MSLPWLDRAIDDRDMLMQFEVEAAWLKSTVR
jgi:hypothetical protein